MKPYYFDKGVTIYHGDCREILPELESIETLITDPVWPNTKAQFQGREDPLGLFTDMISTLPKTKRLVIQLGCDSDPRFLLAVPPSWPFLRVVWLRYACPSYKGRLLLSSDVAYAFGEWPDYIEGRHVIGGEFTSTQGDKMFMRHSGIHKNKVMNRNDIVERLPHPTARRYEHVRFLVAQFSDRQVVDPFMGSGTTILAAKNLNRKCIGIEIEEKYCEIAAKRCIQEVMDLSF